MTGYRPRRRPSPGGLRAGAMLLLLLLVGCGPGRRAPEPAERGPVLPSAEPFVRVGVRVGADSVGASAPGGLRVSGVDPRGRDRPVGTRDSLRIRISGEEMVTDPGEARDGGPWRRLFLEARDGGPVRVEGEGYRGRVEVYRHPRHGLVVVNQLALETYLRGVVPLEIGPRSPEEFEAVKAQAVAARTYAVANLGRRDSLGFDVFGNVEDQVYGGREVERDDATRAVRATAGEILVWRGRPIRAYYHSTGGGTTARVTDVWELEDAPYLRRVEDTRPEGGHYCAISPRYRWEESWSAGELEEAVRAGVERRFGAAEPVGPVRAVEVRERGPEGRIRRLRIRTRSGVWTVEKNDIRFFLRTPDGRALRSTRFDVVEAPPSHEGLRLRGRGYGHGVGMCQWGAIGRARAGHGYREILTHYYPGTEIRGAY